MSDPRFEGISTEDVAALMMICAESSEPSDQEFAKAAVEELKRRKPDLAVIFVGEREAAQKL